MPPLVAGARLTPEGPDVAKITLPIAIVRDAARGTPGHLTSRRSRCVFGATRPGAQRALIQKGDWYGHIPYPTDNQPAPVILLRSSTTRPGSGEIRLGLLTHAAKW